MPRFYIDDISDFFNAASLLSPQNAGPAFGTGAQMTISNDRFTLTVTGSGLVGTTSGGRFAGFSAGEITGLEFRLRNGDGSFTVMGRMDQLSLQASDLALDAGATLVDSANWTIRPLSSGMNVEIEDRIGVHVTLRGSDGIDNLTGGMGSDLVYGGTGDDEIRYRAGFDTMYGGAGDDFMSGFNSIQNGATVYGGAGHDSLRDANRAYGGAGADSVSGYDGILFGGVGRDEVSGYHRLYGGDGDDIVWAGDGGTAYGGDGNDSMMSGQPQEDGPNANYLYGGLGDDLMTAYADTPGLGSADEMEGGAGNDTLKGEGGADTLRGGDGRDGIYGGDNADRLSGGAHDDRLYGDAGTDNLFSGTGADRLYGGAGSDTLSGGAGDDTLSGDAGDDNLRGGAGSDLFVFGTGFGADRIFDFDGGMDRLQFAIAMNAETTAEGVRLTSATDDSEVILVGADLSDVDGIDNVFLI